MSRMTSGASARFKGAAKRLHRAPLRRAALGLGLLASCLAAAPGCARNDRAQASAKRPVTVSVAEAAQRSVPVEIKTFGNVEAYKTVSVKSLVGGQLTVCHINEGQAVKAGEVLFTIDPRPYEAALRQAEANLARDTAEARNAELEASRVEALLKKGVAAQADFDQARTAAEALAAAVQADQAAVQNARLQLEYCTLRSPLDGRVGSVFLNQGNVIKANDLTMVVINQTRPIYVTFSAPEQRLPEIRRAMAAGALPVRAAIPGDEGPPAEGQLSFIDNAVDETTGMIRLKATFENSDERLWPGQFVNVVLTLATRPRAIVVPSRAVQTSQQGRFVFVVKADLGVEVRPVEVGQPVENDMVIEKGLQAGERVVTDGLLRLTAESKVQIGGAAGTGERRAGGEPAEPTAAEAGGATKTGGGAVR